jgi:hypothetical protein
MTPLYRNPFELFILKFDPALFVQDFTPTTDHRSREANTFALQRGHDNYATPAEFFNVLDAEFRFSRDPQTRERFDPCPINPEGLRVIDGLGETPDWARSYYMNPPYSDCEPWLDRAIRDRDEGRTVVVLLRGDTSTKWFHEKVLAEVGVENLRFVKGRLKFPLQKDGRTVLAPAPFASILAIYRPRPPNTQPTGALTP